MSGVGPDRGNARAILELAQGNYIRAKETSVF